MQLASIYFLLLCVCGMVSWIIASPYNYYQTANVGRFGGSIFGEGVLRPGGGAGEGVLSELDAPSFSPPSHNGYRAYTY